MAIKSKLDNATRNQPCPCGSELKQKYCHDDPKKLQICNQVAQLYMIKLIGEERKKRGIVPYDFTCEKCGKGTDQPRRSEIDKRVLMCPDDSCCGTMKKNEICAAPDFRTNVGCDQCSQKDCKMREKKNSLILEA